MAKILAFKAKEKIPKKLREEAEVEAIIEIILEAKRVIIEK